MANSVSQMAFDNKSCKKLLQLEVSRKTSVWLSAAVVESLKRVHIRDELLGCPYVRINSSIDVPFGIIQICTGIAFFLCLDEWDINSKGLHG